MRVRFWGTRGSLATPGPETVRYGGETSCVEVRGRDDDHLLVLDAGTGLRRLGDSVPPEVRRIDLLLSHLHLDHIIGLGFFAPLFRPELRITIWGPPSPETTLLERIGRYLSPPLFPLRVRDLEAHVDLREAPVGPFACGSFELLADPVIHPDPAVGYRIGTADGVLAYLPDHEPALSGPAFPREAAWTSGSEIARDADLLVHDGQYTESEYAERIGWGHSSAADAVAFAELVGARNLALFHHDPNHSDEAVDTIVAEAQSRTGRVDVLAAREGDELRVGAA